MINNNYKKTGFTLLETLIYVAIFSILIVTINSFFNTLSFYKTHSQIAIEVNDQGSDILRVINRSIKNSKSILGPTSGLNSNILNLETYDVATNPTVISISSDGFLEIKEGSGDIGKLNNEKVLVENLIFSNIGAVGVAGAIETRFTLKNRQSIKQSENFSSDFYGTASVR